MFWTYAAAEEEANWAEWRSFLPEAGQWEVWVYIPDQHASTTNARYRVVHLDGRDEVSVNLGNHSDEWVLLATYPCEPGRGYVRLNDVTGEQAQGAPLMVGFDAVCWTKAS